MLNSILSWLFLLAMCQAVFLGMALLSARQRQVRSAKRLLKSAMNRVFKNHTGMMAGEFRSSATSSDGLAA